jgi:predicted lysophospholipase L1 biosynthesis ABC-type transport system permease subunit
MENEKYLKDIQDIKQMMAQSSRFLSLSGLSGILAGIYSLIGAWFAYKTIYFDTSTMGSYRNLVISYDAVLKLFIIAASVIILSIITGIILSLRKANKANENLWNPISKRLLINFLIPLLTGGFFILFLLEKEMLSIIAPLMLIFYGLACLNASKYTLGDVRYLGITMILLGLLSTWFLGYGLLFWALGFGVCHIVYGALMYFKYDRN